MQNNTNPSWFDEANELFKHKPGILPDRVTIFLDIDGVFNSQIYTRKVNELRKSGGVELPYPYNSFDPIIVDNFNKLYEQIGSYINVVITSSWRVDSNLPEIWRQVGFNFMYDGVTPYNPEGCRGDEIVAFLKAHDMLYGNFVIIDDDFDMGEHNVDYLGGCWYLTDPKFGMTKTFLEEVIIRISRFETDSYMLTDVIVDSLVNDYAHCEGRHLRTESLRWLGEDYEPLADDINLERLSITHNRGRLAMLIKDFEEKMAERNVEGDDEADGGEE